MKKFISFVIVSVFAMSLGCYAQDRRSAELQNKYKQLVLQEIDLKAQLETVTRDKERVAGMIIEYTRVLQERERAEEAKKEASKEK